MMHVGCTGLTELEHMPDSVATTVRIPDTPNGVDGHTQPSITVVTPIGLVSSTYGDAKLCIAGVS